MYLFPFFLTIVSVIFTRVIHGEVKKFHCEIRDKGCYLRGLNYTSVDKYFLEHPYHPITEIEYVSMLDSKVEVLTGDICQTLPFVKEFFGRSMGLTFLDENAFEKCTKLESVELSDNSLTTLPPKIFYWNEQLEYVGLFHNKLIHLDENVFQNNKKLNLIILTENQLRYLPTNLFKNVLSLMTLYLEYNHISDLSFLEEEAPIMENLEVLHLDHNQLSDVNVELLYRNCSNLEQIHLVENEFWCERQLQIGASLTAKGITFYGLTLGTKHLKGLTVCIEDRKTWEATKAIRKFERENVKKQIMEITAHAQHPREDVVSETYLPIKVEM